MNNPLNNLKLLILNKENIKILENLFDNIEKIFTKDRINKKNFFQHGDYITDYFNL